MIAPDEQLPSLAGFGGWVIRPGDADYDTARAVWNAMFDRHPAMILRCTTTADVVAAVGIARQRGLEVAVRRRRGSGAPGHHRERRQRCGIDNGRRIVGRLRRLGSD